MNVLTKRRRGTRRAFTMLELMIVVIIVGVLAAIATPIYAKYVEKSRFTEATSRMGEILTAAKAYAIDNDADGDPETVNWPEDCSADGFIGDCTQTTYFDYGINGTGSVFTITATGRPGKMSGREVIMKVSGLKAEGEFEFRRPPAP